MAKSILIDHQPVNVAPGTYVFERAIDNPGRLLIQIARCTTATPAIWPSENVILLISLDLSYDGGASWQLEWLPAFGGPGGIALLAPKFGNNTEVAQTEANVSFPPTANRVRLNATVTGGQLVTALNVERLDG